jgi:Icc-related predicted phosphoesterase
VRLVCLSDLHSKHDRVAVPDGDLLLVAGDLTKRGTREQIEAVDRWLGTLPHRHKVVIAGNHDFAFEEDPGARAWLTHATYLQDELAVVGGVRIWGSPWQPRFFDWAFNLDRGEPLRAVWAKIPDRVDVLLTHGPPNGILDRTIRGDLVGDHDLRDAVFRVRPKLHVFGHIHEGYGQEVVDGVRFVNASTCTVSYVPSNPPIVVDLA